MYEFLNNRVVIEVQGEDAFKFLQNLITNDLAKNNYCYSYILSNQGRYLFDFFIHKANQNKYLLDIEAENTIALQARLNLYKLRSRVEISPAGDDYKIIYSQTAPHFTCISSSNDPRYHRLGYRSIVLSQDTPQGLEFSEGLYLKDKYKLAIPDGIPDLIYDKSIPVEYGAEELGAISYSKGCYMGQEVISRTKYQGVVRKKIFKIHSQKDLSNIVKGEEIIASNINVGIFCSGKQNQGIALIREEKYYALAEKLATISGIEVELSKPDWRK